MDVLTYLLPDPYVTVLDEIAVDPTCNMIICAASMTPITAACPACQQVPARIHSCYRHMRGGPVCLSRSGYTCGDSGVTTRAARRKSSVNVSPRWLCPGLDAHDDWRKRNRPSVWQRAQKAHDLHGQGWTHKAIADHLGICPKTVGRYLHRELPLAPLRRSRRGSLLDAYKPYLLGRWNAGAHNAAQFFREIQPQGCCGQISSVRACVGEVRRASGLPPGKRNAPGEPVETDPSRRPPTVRALAFLVVRPPAKLNDDEKEIVDCLTHVHPNVQTTVELARAFAAMVRQKQVDALDGWMGNAATSPIPALRSFASGLRQDESAVRAALSLPYSHGPTEGHINRLKSLKPAMYGRAKLICCGNGC